MGFTSEENAGKDAVEELGAELTRLEEGLKEKLDAMSAEQLKAYVGKVALDEMANKERMKEDKELEEKKEAFDAAKAPYKEATAANKTRIEYCKYLLDGMGAI